MRRLSVLAAVPLFAACAGSHPASGGGLQGTVARGPITPTCSKNDPCSKPAGGVTLTFSRAGKVVARIETDDKGSYRVMLAPGNYFVLSAQPVRPQHVSVPSSGFRRIDFSIDTKIR